MQCFAFECGCLWDTKLPFCPIAGHGAPLVSERVEKGRKTYIKFQDWVQQMNDLAADSSRCQVMSPLQYMNAALRTDMSFKEYGLIAERLKDTLVAKLLHSVMGKVTEAGELMDVLKCHLIYGKPIDWINVIEEFGDDQWYTALGIDAIQEGSMGGMSFEILWDKNIRKLQKRYPNKFSEEAALNRDRDAERKELET